MKTDDFDFELPQELIALKPIEPRTASRLLCVTETGDIRYQHFNDLLDMLQPGDCLVLNDTKVIKARLNAAITTPGRHAKIELTLIKIFPPAASDRHTLCSAFARGAKKLRIGDTLSFSEDLTASVTDKNPETGEITLRFDTDLNALHNALEKIGDIPLPPYIAAHRKPDKSDEETYQTVFAANPGSVAAPTASLHFDTETLTRAEAKGVTVAKLTLHVGAGTFLPVKADNIADHVMHTEYFSLSEETARIINNAREKGGRVIAVGSTAMRTLESCADKTGRLSAQAGETDIFITPGYRFKIVDCMLTNFHLPRSTLFMLVCAFSGVTVMKNAYREAVNREYRFFSYGDACFLHKAPSPIS